MTTKPLYLSFEFLFCYYVVVVFLFSIIFFITVNYTVENQCWLWSLVQDRMEGTTELKSEYTTFLSVQNQTLRILEILLIHCHKSLFLKIYMDSLPLLPLPRRYYFHDHLFVSSRIRVRNLKFATYLKFATCANTNKINELRWDLLNV